MDKHTTKRFGPPSAGAPVTFRFEDGDTAAGHAIVFPQAIAPRFALRRESEGDYVLPAR